MTRPYRLLLRAVRERDEAYRAIRAEVVRDGDAVRAVLERAVAEATTWRVRWTARVLLFWLAQPALAQRVQDTARGAPHTMPPGMHVAGEWPSTVRGERIAALGGAAVAPAVELLLKESLTGIEGAAVLDALGMLADPDTAPPLRHVMDHGPAHFRRRAAYVLGILALPEDFPRLIARLGDERESDAGRELALRALFRGWSSAAFDAARDAALDARAPDALRAAATHIVASIGGPAAAGALVDVWRGEWNTPLAATVRGALIAASAPETTRELESLVAEADDPAFAAATVSLIGEVSEHLRRREPRT